MQVREFKKKIEDTVVKIKNQEGKLDDLNEKAKTMQCDKHDAVDQATNLAN